MREQADALRERAEVRVLYLDVMPRGDRRKPTRSLMLERGYVEERVEVPNLPGLWQFAYLLTMRRELRRLRREFAPQVLHAHIAVPAGWGASLLKGSGAAPLVLTEHSSEFNSWMRRPGLRRMAQTAFRRADVVVAVSEGQRGLIERTFGRHKRLAVVPEMVDTKRFPVTALPDTSDGYRMLLVGLLDTDQKGVHVLIEALDLVRKRGLLDKPVTVTVAGDGRLLPQYEEQARRLGLSDAVKFAGRRTRDEIARLLADSHALVMPSLHESAGVALIEAMVSGRPAIVTRSGGPEYYIADEGGLIVEPGNAEQLGSAVEDLLPNLHRYEPSAIASRAAALYGSEAVADRLLAIYEKLARR